MTARTDQIRVGSGVWAERVGDEPSRGGTVVDYRDAVDDGGREHRTYYCLGFAAGAPKLEWVDDDEIGEVNPVNVAILRDTARRCFRWLACRPGRVTAWEVLVANHAHTLLVHARGS